MTDYALWEVILNGDSPLPTRTVDGVETVVSPTTVEQNSQLDNEDLKQIDPDELEEMELEVADGNADNERKDISQEEMKESRRGHFAREYMAPKNKDSRNKETTTRTAPIEETTSNALYRYKEIYVIMQGSRDAGANLVRSMVVPRCSKYAYLEEIVYSDDDEDVGAEANMTNLDIHIPVSRHWVKWVDRNKKDERGIVVLEIIARLDARVTLKKKEFFMMSEKKNLRRYSENKNRKGACENQNDDGFLDSEYWVNAGDSKVIAATARSVNAVRLNLVLLVQVNAVEDDFINTSIEAIVDFLNAHPIKYALTVNPTIYTACIEQFWATTKVKTVNGEVQIQALVDKKKLTLIGYENLAQKLTFYKAFFLPQWKFLIHTILQYLSAKTTAWNEFSSTTASAVICLATNKNFNFSKYIFDNMVKNLEGGVKFLMYLRFVQVFLDKQVEGMSKHKKIYVTPSHTKKVFANMKRQGKDFSGRDTPLFPTMIVQAQEQESEGSVMPTVPQYTPTINQPSSSQPQKKQKPRKSKKQNTKVSQPSDSTEPMADETENVESVPTHSIDPLLKIAKLKERVKKLERKNKSRTTWLKRLRKVGRTARIESSKDEGLGDQEDASKQGRKTTDIDADEEVTLIDETQGRNNDNLMFDTGVLDEQEVEVEKVVSTAEVTTASATTTTIDELTLAQTLIEIKAAKPKAVKTAATTTTIAVTRPKARGVVVQEPSEFTTTTSQSSQLPHAKDKGKAKMVELEKPLKKKDQILIDKEIA
ncbi:hypothetical protein Tco_0353338 [Tanacetum coccineum]